MDSSIPGGKTAAAASPENKAKIQFHILLYICNTYIFVLKTGYFGSLFIMPWKGCVLHFFMQIVNENACIFMEMWRENLREKTDEKDKTKILTCSVFRWMYLFIPTPLPVVRTKAL
jgi:hypothetical protein